MPKSGSRTPDEQGRPPATPTADETGGAPETTRGRGRWPKGGIAAAAVELLRHASGPLTLDELIAGLSRDWDLRENARARLRAAVKENVHICLVATSTYDMVERRLAGARLHHVLTAAELRHGLLLAEPDLDDLLQWWQPYPGAGGPVELLDPEGAAQPAVVALLTGPQPAGRTVPTGLEDRVYRVLVGLADWLQAEGARPGDEICFCPEPPDARRFRVSLHRGGTNRPGEPTADALLAETALAILKAAKTMLSPHDLLLRLAGRMDLRAVPAVHFPVFVLGRDRRAVFDSVFYATRAVAERMDPRPVHTPYPLPEDYPSDWPHRDPIEELARQVTSMLPPGAWPAARPAAEGGLRAQVATLHPQILRRLAEERTVVWDLLQDRSRLLNPTDPDRTTRGKLIRGPWPG